MINIRIFFLFVLLIIIIIGNAQAQDTTGPEITVVSLSEMGDGDTYIEKDENVNISFYVNDSSGVNKVEIFQDGINISTINNPGNNILLSATTTTGLTRGLHNITIIASDMNATSNFNTITEYFYVYFDYVVWIEYTNNTILGANKVMLADHSIDTNEGNWVVLSGGQEVPLPPIRMDFSSIDSQTVMGGTVIAPDAGSYIYPFLSNRIYTNNSGYNCLGAKFKGNTEYADLQVDIRLIKLNDPSCLVDPSSLSLAELFNNYDIENSTVILDSAGDVDFYNCKHLSSGTYLIVVTLPDNENNNDSTMGVLGLQALQVLSYESSTTAPTEVIKGQQFNVSIEMPDAPGDDYTYNTFLINMNDIMYSGGFDVSINGSIITLNGVNIANLDLASITPNSCRISTGSNDNYCTHEIQTDSSWPSGNYILYNIVNTSGNNVIAFNQSSIILTTGITPSTTVSIENVTAATGETITVPIMINNVMDLGGCQINMTYDSSVVHVTGVTQGDMTLLAYNINNGSGWINANAIETSGGNGDVVFAYVNLTAIADWGNSSVLDITVDKLCDITYCPILHTVIDGAFTIADIKPPQVLDATTSRDVILNDNGRPRAPGTNITVLNVTALDAESGISTVTIDLSSIGGSKHQPMEKISGTNIWTVTTNALIGINLTHQLTINATDNEGNYNNSVNITLTVLRRGDVNRDNLTDINDVVYIARYLASIPPECDNPPDILVGDVVGISGDPMGDGIVDLLDALYIARYEAGMEAEP